MIFLSHLSIFKSSACMLAYRVSHFHEISWEKVQFSIIALLHLLLWICCKNSVKITFCYYFQISTCNLQKILKWQRILRFSTLEDTVWKFGIFPATQILREIIFAVSDVKIPESNVLLKTFLKSWFDEFFGDTGCSINYLHTQKKWL